MEFGCSNWLALHVSCRGEGKDQTAYLVFAPKPQALNGKHGAVPPLPPYELCVKLSVGYGNHAWQGQRLTVTTKDGRSKRQLSPLLRLLGIKLTMRQAYSFCIGDKHIGFVESTEPMRALTGVKAGTPMIVVSVRFRGTSTNELTITVPWQKAPLFHTVDGCTCGDCATIWLTPDGQTHASFSFEGRTAGSDWQKPKNGRPYFTIKTLGENEHKFGVGWIGGGTLLFQ